MRNITLSDLRKIFPKTKSETLEQYVTPLNETFEKFDISTTARQSMFIAQIGHESANFTAVRENLNYSAQGLRRIFGKYFPTDALANTYARQPEKIANRVYANRMSNGPESSGDGWKFRGRGTLQVTGRYGYTNFAKDFGMSIDDAIVYLETSEGAVMSAGWFWEKNNLNSFADQTRFTDMTKRINGGTNGLAHRKELWNIARSILT
jgi:putative chitinase